MIKNALAVTDADTGLWSQLKSIDHTLARVLATSGGITLSDLDRERLSELALFLKERALQSIPAEPLSTESLLRESKFVAGIPVDFRDKISNNEMFKNWQSAAKVGFERKIQKLIQEIETFRNKSKQEFVSVNAATPEFAILRDIISGVLADIEAAQL